MDNSQPSSYHEDFLQWLWAEMHFDFEKLKSSCGKRIILHDPGRLNESDGPDFTGASVTVEGLRWYGDIEIHRNAADWYTHGHHQDPSYNRVILHVVFNHTEVRPTLRTDGTEVYLLPIKEYLHEDLAGLVEQFNRTERLPCAGNLKYISEQAFQRQLAVARKKYFEQKVDHILSYYDPNLLPSAAWKQALITGMFDVLGISHNREPMVELAKKLLKTDTDSFDQEQLIAYALRRAGITGKSEHVSTDWKFKGSRPANQPPARISQAAVLMKIIQEERMDNFLHMPPKTLWNQLIDRFETVAAPGRQQRRILYAVVFLPGLYLLGHLLCSQSLKDRAYGRWETVQVPVPQSILRPFETAGLPPGLYRKNIGAVYQFKQYCKPRRCQRCQVFKTAINS